MVIFLGNSKDNAIQYKPKNVCHLFVPHYPTDIMNQLTHSFHKADSIILHVSAYNPQNDDKLMIKQNGVEEFLD